MKTQKNSKLIRCLWITAILLFTVTVCSFSVFASEGEASVTANGNADTTETDVTTEAAETTVKTVHEILVPDEGEPFRFYSQKSLTENDNGTWDYRIVCVIDWDWVLEIPYADVKMHFTSSAEGEEDVTMSHKPQTVFNHILGYMDDTCFEYTAGEGCVLLGWIIRNVPATYAPISCEIEYYTKGLAYTLNDTGNAYTVSGIGTATDTDIYIPKTYEDLPVTSVGERAFYNCTNLTSITIGNSVTSIGNYAFSYCTGLTSITIPSSVTSIGNSAFSYCYCTGLTSITIPSSVTSIGNSAFFGCYSLTSIMIPASVTSIGKNAFNNCNNLTSIVVDENNSSYSSQDGILYNKVKTEFVGIPKNIQGSIVIPHGISSIGNSAFDGCTGLTNITIPNSVTSFGFRAFYGCSSLTNITIPDSVTSIESQVFYGCYNLSGITIPDSVTSIGVEVFYNCTRLASITLSSKLTSIGDHMFYYCRSLTNITIPSGVTSIGNSAFFYCESLTNITIPSSVTSIGNNAFFYCESLTNITIPSSVTSIGNNAFSYCSSLTNITIPASVTSIGKNAFNNCDNLTSIVVDENNSSYSSQDGILYNKVKTEFIGIPKNIQGSIVIPHGIPSIGNSAFSYCSNLVSITIPDSVISIGNNAFSYCTSLTSITIPDSVISIGNNAFDGCTGLTTVMIGSGVASIGITNFGNSVFYYCSDLTSITVDENNSTYSSQDGILYNKAKTEFVHIPYNIQGQITIPNSITSIEDSAFFNHDYLTSITIPDSVTSIGNSAFRSCDNLTSIIFTGTMAEWNAITKIGSWTPSISYTIHCSDGDIAK